jgi:type II secretory pathway pseudopilin PulG
MRSKKDNAVMLKHGEAGFTFVEVLVAVSLVLTLFVSLYLGLSFGFAVTRSEREDLRATQIMLERMEGIRLFTWDQLEDSSKNPPTFTNYFTPSDSGYGAEYIGTMNVTTNPALNPPASYSTNMRLVTVTVHWVSGNVTRTRSMSTYVSKNGVQNYIYNN